MILWCPNWDSGALVAGRRSSGWYGGRHRTGWSVSAVGEGMDIDEQHVAEPGLAVLDVTAADDSVTTGA